MKRAKQRRYVRPWRQVVLPMVYGPGFFDPLPAGAAEQIARRVAAVKSELGLK